MQAIFTGLNVEMLFLWVALDRIPMLPTVKKGILQRLVLCIKIAQVVSNTIVDEILVITQFL